MLPEKTLALAGDTYHCGKHSNERLTVLNGSEKRSSWGCENMLGSEKRLMVVMGI